MLRSTSAALLAAAALALPSAAAAAAPNPAFVAGSVEDRLEAETRGADQTANLDYLQRFRPLLQAYAADQTDDGVLVDPYRLDWGGTRGQHVAVSWRNRWGARIPGNLWAPKLPFRDPVTGALSDGPFPAVVLLSGLGNEDDNYRGMQQSLAEAGYVVLSFDPQGQADADVRPSPEDAFCDPHGEWREPQEMGLREKGPCAGVYNPPKLPGDDGPGGALDGTPLEPVGTTLDNGLVLAELFADGDYPAEELERAANESGFRNNFILGALDATAWMLSDANPLRSLVDSTRIGVAGHSAGADGAVNAANGDPAGRFRAAVAWDSALGLLPTVQPRVPTMHQYAESQNVFGPYRSAPDALGLPAHRLFERFRAAGAPTMSFAPRGSTHQEWLYLPYQMINPYLAPLFNASRYGERVGLYYTQAWFDRWLKGAATGRVRGDEAQQAADARRRLTARTLDASADASSIGTGRMDPLTLRNVPYAIAGHRVADRVSRILPSGYAFDGLTCLDLLAGCTTEAAAPPLEQQVAQRSPVALLP